MNHEWEPGDVAAATVNGRPNVRLIAGWSKYDPQLRWGELSTRWADGDDDECWFMPSQVKDHRPLVIIDPEDAKDVAKLVRLFWAHGTDDGDDPRAMQAALREYATPTPPKPEEPTGRYAVVEDSSALEWVHADIVGTSQWKCLTLDRWADYDDIDAVRVLSEGVTP